MNWRQRNIKVSGTSLFSVLGTPSLYMFHDRYLSNLVETLPLSLLTFSNTLRCCFQCLIWIFLLWCKPVIPCCVLCISRKNVIPLLLQIFRLNKPRSHKLSSQGKFFRHIHYQSFGIFPDLKLAEEPQLFEILYWTLMWFLSLWDMRCLQFQWI